MALLLFLWGLPGSMDDTVAWHVWIGGVSAFWSNAMVFIGLGILIGWGWQRLLDREWSPKAEAELWKEEFQFQLKAVVAVVTDRRSWVFLILFVLASLAMGVALVTLWRAVGSL